MSTRTSFQGNILTKNHDECRKSQRDNKIDEYLPASLCKFSQISAYGFKYTVLTSSYVVVAVWTDVIL